MKSHEALSELCPFYVFAIVSPFVCIKTKEALELAT